MNTFRTSVLLIFTLVASAAAQCPTENPISLCCITYEPASDAVYVLENVCGLQVNPSEMVALGCEQISW